MQIGNFNMSSKDLLAGGMIIGGTIVLIDYITKKVKANNKKAREELEAYRTEQLSSVDIKAVHDLMNESMSTEEDAQRALILNIEILRLKGLAEVSDSKASIKKYVDEIKEISEAYSNKDTLSISTLAIRYKEKKEKRALESEREYQLSLIREKAKIEAETDLKVTNRILDAVNGFTKIMDRPSISYRHIVKSDENNS